MIRLLKEHYWLEAHEGCGPVLSDPRHVIVGDKVYVPRVRERLQYWGTRRVDAAARYADGSYIPASSDSPSTMLIPDWVDVPTVESPLPEPPSA